MAVVDRERVDELARKAEALRADWVLTREEHLAEQLAANVEVRRVWIESDSTYTRQSLLGRFDLPSFESEIPNF